MVRNAGRTARLRRVRTRNLAFARRQLGRARRLFTRDLGAEFERGAYLEIFLVLRYVFLLLPIVYIPFALYDFWALFTQTGPAPMAAFDGIFYLILIAINLVFQRGDLHRGSLRNLRLVCRLGVGLLAALGTSATLLLLSSAPDLSIFSGTLLAIAVIFRFPDRFRFVLYAANYLALYGGFFLLRIDDPVLIQNPMFILILIVIFDRVSTVMQAGNFLKNRRIVKLNRMLVQETQDRSDMLSIAVHDLKSPVSGIMGIVKLMRETPFPEDERDEIMADIEHSTRNIIDRIDDLVNIAASPIGHTGPAYRVFDLNALLYANLQNFQYRASLKEARIYTRFQKPRQAAYADPDAASRIFENLLSNAVKFSPRAGSIFVRSTRSGVRGENVEFSVQDEGPGFTREDRRRLFGKFARLSARPTGGESSTGVGLFTVHRLVQSLEGARIELESVPGQGAKFTVTLPRAPLADGLARRRKLRAKKTKSG